MSDYYNAFEISPVPAPGPDAVPPEPFRGIYGMPAFVTIPTTDLAASADFWVRGLGFFELFAAPGRLVHLRRWAFQDGLRQLGAGLDRMIDAHERGVPLTAGQQAEVFGPGWNPDWPAQARRAYGDTAQWAQFAERAAARSPEEWRAVAASAAAFDRALGGAMDAGVTPGSPEANQLAERHRELFAVSYFPLTRQMQACLGRKYETDPAFAARHDGIRPGLATWFRQVIDASARAHGIDPDTATWD